MLSKVLWTFRFGTCSLFQSRIESSVFLLILRVPPLRHGSRSRLDQHFGGEREAHCGVLLAAGMKALRQTAAQWFLSRETDRVDSYVCHRLRIHTSAACVFRAIGNRMAIRLCPVTEVRRRMAAVILSRFWSIVAPKRVEGSAFVFQGTSDTPHSACVVLASGKQFVCLEPAEIRPPIAVAARCPFLRRTPTVSARRVFNDCSSTLPARRLPVPCGFAPFLQCANT
jgi:hypothetical protein